MGNCCSNSGCTQERESEFFTLQKQFFITENTQARKK
jgi:hypothetical protein